MSTPLEDSEVNALLFDGLDAAVNCDAPHCNSIPIYAHTCKHCTVSVMLCTLHTKAMNEQARQIILLNHAVVCAYCQRSFDYPFNWVFL